MDDLAKLAPKLAPRLTLFDIPAVVAIAFVTALPNVFAIAVPVVLATLFDNIIHDESMAIRALVIYFFISNEAISILENWGSLGLPLPKKIFDVFEKLKEQSN